MIDQDADMIFMQLKDGRFHRWAVKDGFAIGVIGRRK